MKVISGDRLVKFTYCDLPAGMAFMTAQIATHEVVYSIISEQTECPFSRVGVEGRFGYEAPPPYDLTDLSNATSPSWFFYKYPDWSNEEEVRLVLPRSLGGPLFQVSNDLLTRVILGEDMAEAIAARVKEWGNDATQSCRS